MNCNFVPVSFEEILKDKEKYAYEFSEKEPLLEEMLKLLWNNNIATVGCCTGHDGQRSTQYVGIRLNVNTNLVIKLLCAINKENVRISFTKLQNKITCSIKKLDNDIYENVKNAITNIDKVEIDEHIKDIAYRFLTNKTDYYYCYHIYYKNDNANEYLNTNDLELIEDYKNKYEWQSLRDGIYHFKLNKAKNVD